MAQSLSNTLIHIVFSTKYRVESIDDGIAPQLFSYIGSICRDLNCDTIIVGGYRDHVHILCRLSRTITIADLIQKVKSNSSRWMKTQGPGFEIFRWQNGYGVFSVSQSNSKYVTKYIKNQKQHHEKKSYQEEYKETLKENDIPFKDDKYLWD